MVGRLTLGRKGFEDVQESMEAIVQQARKLKLAGATVLRGVMGYGAHSRMHAARVLAGRDSAHFPAGSGGPR